MLLRHVARICAVVGFGYLVSGCLGTSTDGELQAGGSCMLSGSSSCSDYADTQYPGSNRTTCEMSIGSISGGTYSSGACPTDNRVGSCKASGASNTQRFYSTGSTPYTTSSVEALCDDEGDVFTPN